MATAPWSLTLKNQPPSTSLTMTRRNDLPSAAHAQKCLVLLRKFETSSCLQRGFVAPREQRHQHKEGPCTERVAKQHHDCCQDGDQGPNQAHHKVPRVSPQQHLQRRIVSDRRLQQRQI